MKILVILECSKDAFKRSRRVVAKYLDQIGRGTYLNDLSEKALISMHKELKESISRNNSIICYKIDRNTKQILFKLGTQKNFTKDGVFVYKKSQSFSSVKEVLKLNKTQEYLLKMTEISAYFHDIGKANIGFQGLLRYVISTDQKAFNSYRHEYVSFLMIYSYFYKKNDNKSELEIIEDIIKHYDSEEYKIESFKIDNSILNLPPNFNSIKKFNKYPVLNSILWLILTHHKLPDNSFNIDVIFDFEEYKKTFGSNSEVFIKYLNQKFQKTYEPKNQLQLNPFLDFKKEHLLFLQDKQYKNSIKNKFLYLKDNYADFLKSVNFNNDINKSKLSSLLTLIARPALVHADYYASYKKVENKELIEESISFANSTFNYEGKKVLADDLLTHLNKVAENVSGYFNMFCSNRKMTDFNHLSKDLLNDLNPKEPVLDKYKWQSDAFNNISGHNISGNPFFGVLMAGTGTGKTRACAQIMKALEPENLRFSVGLGLKTLSCQTKKEYLVDIFKDKSIAEREISLLVGSCLQNLSEDNILRENDKENKDDDFIDDKDDYLESEYHFNGSYSEAMSNQDSSDDYYISDFVELNESMLKDIHTKSKEIALIKSPIVVMTIDHIITAIQQNKSNNLKSLLRIISSDFVIDEIDNYDAKDLISISVLIYVLGYFNKKVLISSATTTTELANTLFDFYQRGVSDNLSMDKNIYYSFINEFSTEVYQSKDLSQESLLSFSNNYNTFTKKAIEEINLTSEKFTKHKMEYLSLNSEKEIYSDILDGVENLHGDNYINYVENNKNYKISIGFVKFNNIEESQNFCKYINENQNKKEKTHLIKWINYHSNFMNLERFFIEDWLDTNMKRKQSNGEIHDSYGSEHIFKTDYFQSLISEANNCGTSEIVLVLSTTNIIEVGRDHDYDWCIIEPSGIKNIVQAIGRVKRHRSINTFGLEESYKNVFLFNRIIKEIKKGLQHSKNIMAYPGIQTDIIKIKESSMPLFSLSENTTIPKKIKNLTIKPSLNLENVYSKIDFRIMNNDPEYVFKNNNYMSNYIINSGFRKNPNNSYLMKIFMGSYEDQFKEFRLLQLDKLKQEIFLNSNYSPLLSEQINDKTMNYSARFYLDNLNNENYITKLGASFYKNNKFRRSSGFTKKIYMVDSYQSLIGNNNLLFEYKQFGSVIEERVVNGKTKLFNNPNLKEFYNNYDNDKIPSANFFRIKDSFISYKDMYLTLSQKYKLDSNAKNVRFSMLELSITLYNDEDIKKMKYYKGLGVIKN